MEERTEKVPISDMMETTMRKVKEMIDANTIVGEPITTVDGITLIPVSKLSLGFAGGGSDIAKKNDLPNGFGGGIGAGIKIEPVVFIVVIGENVKLLHITPPAETTLDRLIETVPEVIDKVSGMIKKEKD
ncbi:MAG: GerW family sporulation protein [Oscillospiraceae bacterium]|nr:GerW family sporulation protein [Oscillospiraceae bacterium]